MTAAPPGRNFGAGRRNQRPKKVKRAIEELVIE
jgi:hypothetical protein